MPSNIEIKAGIQNWSEMESRVKAISDTDAQKLIQKDIFFNVPNGRLKLRLFADGSGELIQYQRPDTQQTKQSQYQIYKTANPQQLQETLEKALGIWVVVEKTRNLYHVGQTRIHMDQVKGLGNFLELEVVLQFNQNPEEGHAIAEYFIQQLQVQKSDLIDVAYADLLLKKTMQNTR